MTDMVERVARALCDDTLKRWRSPIALQSEPWREFIPAARAAIAAMKDIPPEMIDKALGTTWGFGAADWNMLIDAALSRQREGE